MHISLGITLYRFFGSILFIKLKLQKNISGESQMESLCILLICFTILKFNFIVCIYFLVGFNDIFRVNFCLKQLSKIIQLRESSDKKSKKYLPTINFLDSFTIKSWGDLREIFQSYGRQFLYRFEIFISFSFVFILLKLFSEVQVIYMVDEETKTNVIIPQILYQNIPLDLLPFIIMMLVVFLGAASVNSYFKTHKSHISQVKQVVNDLYRLRYFYFEDKIRPSNMLFRFCVKHLSKRFTLIDTERNEITRK